MDTEPMTALDRARREAARREQMAVAWLKLRAHERRGCPVGGARAWHFDLLEVRKLLAWLSVHDPMFGEESDRLHVTRVRGGHCEFERALELLSRPWEWNGRYEAMAREHTELARERAALDLDAVDDAMTFAQSVEEEIGDRRASL